MRLVVAGPGLDVQGGITSVERLILENLPTSICATHVATMVDGTRAAKLWTFAKAVVAFECLLRSGTDLVHINFASGASNVRKQLIARRALGVGTPVVMHAHGGGYRDYWREMSTRGRRRTLSVLTAASALLVLGRYWQDFFVEIGVRADRVHVLPNPIRLPDKVPTRQDRPYVTFLFLGKISQGKGTFELLEAFGRLPASMQISARLVFAGNGETTLLRTRVKRLGLEWLVTVHDWVAPTMRDRLLAQADVFALPSHNEGLPMAMLEAMAWGLPVLTTPVGSIPEVVEEGVSGMFVPPGDVDAISEALAAFLSDRCDRHALGTGARRVAETHSVDRYIDRLTGIYRQVIDQR